MIFGVEWFWIVIGYVMCSSVAGGWMKYQFPNASGIELCCGFWPLLVPGMLTWLWLTRRDRLPVARMVSEPDRPKDWIHGADTASADAVRNALGGHHHDDVGADKSAYDRGGE